MKRILLVDNYDSFTYNVVHLFARLGVTVDVLRNDDPRLDTEALRAYDGVVVGPGPGRPTDAGRTMHVIGEAVAAGKPLLGICLGQQAIGEYFGGQLGQLGQPAHGRPSQVQVRGGRLMQNLPDEIVIGRYHSLYVEGDSMPDVLSVTATTGDGVAMAIEHKTLPVGGVQFHPESLMSLGGEVGLRIVENAFRLGDRN